MVISSRDASSSSFFFFHYYSACGPLIAFSLFIVLIFVGEYPLESRVTPTTKEPPLVRYGKIRNKRTKEIKNAQYVYGGLRRKLRHNIEHSLFSFFHFFLFSPVFFFFFFVMSRTTFPLFSYCTLSPLTKMLDGFPADPRSDVGRPRRREKNPFLLTLTFHLSFCIDFLFFPFVLDFLSRVIRCSCRACGDMIRGFSATPESEVR